MHITLSNQLQRVNLKFFIIMSIAKRLVKTKQDNLEELQVYYIKILDCINSLKNFLKELSYD